MFCTIIQLKKLPASTETLLNKAEFQHARYTRFCAPLAFALKIVSLAVQVHTSEVVIIHKQFFSVNEHLILS